MQGLWAADSAIGVVCGGETVNEAYADMEFDVGTETEEPDRERAPDEV